jgi:hypothetical protein
VVALSFPDGVTTYFDIWDGMQVRLKQVALKINQMDYLSSYGRNIGGSNPPYPTLYF